MPADGENEGRWSTVWSAVRWRHALALGVVTVAVAGCSSPGTVFGDGFAGGADAPGPRPSNACVLLTSDRVAAIVGTPGPFTGAREDPDEDGNPVWGCTWGTQQSYADLRELSAKQWSMATADEPGSTRTPVSGIGEEAMAQKTKVDSYLYFVAGGRYYQAQVMVDRREDDDRANADREVSAEEQLAKAVVPRLADGVASTSSAASAPVS